LCNIITIHNLTINLVFNCFICTPLYTINLISSNTGKKEEQSIKVAFVVAAAPTATAANDEGEDDKDDNNDNTNNK